MVGGTNVTPIVSKIFCFSSETELLVRRRPHLVNGGGLVVMNGGQKVAFTVDGCGILGVKGELIVRDADGTAILLIQKKGGVVQALSLHNGWKGYLMDYEGPTKVVFSLQEPKAFIAMNNPIKISVEPKGCSRGWDFKVTGSFIDRACTISDRRGNIVAQVGTKAMTASKDFYRVELQPGYDQAFVVGVIAVLDNINGESTRC